MAEVQLIAVATSDGENIDAEFGKARSFDIYRITAGEVPGAEFVERRLVDPAEGEGAAAPDEAPCSPIVGCSGPGSGGGCGGGHGCAGAASPQLQRRIAAVSDCVCVLCSHAGPGAQKLLAANAITLFDIVMPIGRALPKVVAWYTRAAKPRS